MSRKRSLPVDDSTPLPTTKKLSMSLDELAKQAQAKAAAGWVVPACCMRRACVLVPEMHVVFASRA